MKGSNMPLKYRGAAPLQQFVQGNPTMLESIQQIAEILHNEHCTDAHSFTDQIALNLDAVESRLTKGYNQEKTVDFVVCLEKNRLLLVEAKFDVKTVKNIADAIADKIRHSKDLLIAQGAVVIDSTTIVLLNCKQFEQRRNKLQRLLLANTAMIKSMRVADFYHEYFE
jgi:hypothetical protein